MYCVADNITICIIIIIIGLRIIHIHFITTLQLEYNLLQEL